MIIDSDNEILKTQEDYFTAINEKLLLKHGWRKIYSDEGDYVEFANKNYKNFFISYTCSDNIFCLRKEEDLFEFTVSSMQSLDEMIQEWS